MLTDQIDIIQEPQSNKRSSLSSYQDYSLEYVSRRKIREQRLSNIKEELQSKFQVKQRKEQNIFLYLFSLCVPLGMSLVNYFIFTDMTQNSKIKTYMVISICFSGMIVTIISNCLLAPWKQILILYFHVDSIVPIFISFLITFYSLLRFFTFGSWQIKVYVLMIPVWVIYFTGHLRVMLVHVKLKRWEVILYKLVVLACGLICFLIGFTYMMGKYKIFNGYQLYRHLQTKLKDLTYLFVFAAMELFFEMFRKLTQFDQTANLKYEYQFDSPNSKIDTVLVEGQYKKAEEQALREELQDLIKEHISRNKGKRPEDSCQKSRTSLD